MPRIELVGVSKIYADGEGLHPTNLVIEDGDFATLLGPSGSGKSTLLRLIAGLETPDQGEILFDGKVVNDVAPFRRGLGLVVTQGALYNHMTAEGNLAFPLEVAHVDRPEVRSRVADAARRFRLLRILPRKARELSAGHRQLIATGRATVRETNIVLFDEALAGVDPHLRASVKDQLRRLRDLGHTSVFATNHQADGMSLANKLVVIRDGEVQQAGTPEDLYTNPVNTFVAQFLGEPGMNIVPVERTGAGSVRFGDDELWLGMTTDTSHDRILLGVRPEHVGIAGPGAPYRECFHGRITFVENLGHERLAHVAFGGPDSGSVDFVFRSSAHGLVAGDRVELQLNPETAAFFDPVSGERLVSATVE